MQKFFHRIVLVIAIICCIAFSNNLFAQQRYPENPITLVVPYAPGGPTDIFARILGQELGKELGQNVVINNNAGAAGNIGTSLVARSVGDGYTLLFGTAAIAVSPSVYKNLNYDAQRDLRPIAMVGSCPALVLTSSTGPDTIEQLISLIKSQPGVFNYATSGIGSPTHIVTEYFNQKAHLDAFAVPYTGAGPAKQGVISNLHLYTFETASSAIALVRSGKLKAIALASDQRSPLLPNVPTISESGIKGVNGSTWNMVFAPEKTPKPVIDRLNKAINKVLSNPVIVKRLNDLAIEVNSTSTPNSAEAFLKFETERWRELVHASQVKVN
jgi:tripartite-type tricarboxylate transporter receptor subunit TctC